MAIAEPPRDNIVQTEFRKMVRDNGRSLPTSEFLNGEILEAGIAISNHTYFDRLQAAHGKEHAIKRAMLNVARGCPKMCSDCWALEMVGTEIVSPANFESIIKVRSRCTSAGYCPNRRVEWPARTASSNPADFEREYVASFSKPDPLGSYFPNMPAPQPESSYSFKPESVEEPSSAPKTKPDLVW